MASFQCEDDGLVSCPYDPCHRVKKCRIQYHIASCRKKHKDEPKKVCPFNARHHIPGPEYYHHLQTCENRDIADREIARFSGEEVTVKRPTTPPTIYSSENWDDELKPYFAPGYDPSMSQKKIIFKDTTGMLPSERKKYYNSLHAVGGDPLYEEPEKENRTETPERTLKELRQPMAKPEVMQFNSPPLPEERLSLGLGRGQTSSNRRIAANIFGEKNVQANTSKKESLGEKNNQTNTSKKESLGEKNNQTNALKKDSLGETNIQPNALKKESLGEKNVQANAPKEDSLEENNVQVNASKKDTFRGRGIGRGSRAQ